MKAIYKREVASYFNSMIGYLCVAAMVVFVGIYFMAYNMFQGYPYFSAALGSSMFAFLGIVPLLTMRSLSEERHSRTDQLLLTAPVTVTEIVLGKYLAMLTVFLVPMLICCLCPLIISLNGTAYLAADYAAILAFFLLGAVQIGVGLLISSLTESAIIAAIGTFAVLLVLQLWDGLLSFLPVTAVANLVGLIFLLLAVCLLLHAFSNHWKVTAAVLFGGLAALLGFFFYDSTKFEGLLAESLGKFSLLAAFDSFAGEHVFDLPGLLLYLSLIALLLFLTVQVMQKRRWN